MYARMEAMKKRTNIWLDDNDRGNIVVIRMRYGLKSTSAAITFALNEVAAHRRSSANDSQIDSQNEKAAPAEGADTAS